MLEESSFGPSLYRSSSIQITGKGVNRLTSEGGTHRVSRIPQNERRGRRHTSAVTVSVLPVPERLSDAFDLKDVRVETFKASGAGGQHRNKTMSAIRAIHVPTGLKATIADERSQSSNKDRALALLAARVAERRSTESKKDHDRRRAAQHGSGHISERFRSYLWREGTVVDHQSGLSAPLRQVLDGDLSTFLARRG